MNLLPFLVQETHIFVGLLLIKEESHVHAFQLCINNKVASKILLGAWG